MINIIIVMIIITMNMAMTMTMIISITSATITTIIIVLVVVVNVIITVTAFAQRSTILQPFLSSQPQCAIHFAELAPFQEVACAHGWCAAWTSTEVAEIAGCPERNP